MDRQQVPIITEAELFEFHKAHFDVPLLHGSLSRVAESPETETDGLGYYPDGVKRSLTEEQIAMFRHTEIQTLLRKRLEAEEGIMEMSSNASPVLEVGTIVKAPRPEGEDLGDIDEEQEYAQFLQWERREFQKVAAQKRNGERTTYEPGDRTISTRRKVREMDAIQMTNEVLVYDEESVPAQQDTGSAASKVRGIRGPAEKGRKIWFPMIG